MGQNHRVVIIGVGAIATMHAKAIGDLDQVELVGGCCRSRDKGEKFAADYDCQWFDDYEKALDELKPDFVTISTPSGAHLEPTLACAKRGIHVLCEKPLEISTERVDRMIAAAGEGGIRLGGIFPQRFNPVVCLLHDAARDGRFGDLAAVSTYVPWWRDDAYYAPERWQGTIAMDGGGAMINQSIHGIDAVQWLAAAAMPEVKLSPDECPVEEVFAYTAKRGHPEDMIEVEDTAVAVMRYRNGAVGLILGTTSMYPGGTKRIEISGRNGTAEVKEEDLLIWQFRKDQPNDEAIRDEHAPGKGFGGAGSDPLAVDYTNHRSNIIEFLEALDAGKSPTINGREARKAVAIIEAAYASAKSGKPMKVK